MSRLQALQPLQQHSFVPFEDWGWCDGAQQVGGASSAAQSQGGFSPPHQQRQRSPAPALLQSGGAGSSSAPTKAVAASFPWGAEAFVPDENKTANAFCPSAMMIPCDKKVYGSPDSHNKPRDDDEDDDDDDEALDPLYVWEQRTPMQILKDNMCCQAICAIIHVLGNGIVEQGKLGNKLQAEKAIRDHIKENHYSLINFLVGEEGLKWFDVVPGQCGQYYLSNKDRESLEREGMMRDDMTRNMDLQRVSSDYQQPVQDLQARCVTAGMGQGQSKRAMTANPFGVQALDRSQGGLLGGSTEKEKVRIGAAFNQQHVVGPTLMQPKDGAYGQPRQASAYRHGQDRHSPRSSGLRTSAQDDGHVVKMSDAEYASWVRGRQLESFYRM